MSFTFLLLTHIGATLAMSGLIWFVQVVHYPLMARVGNGGFPAYHALHRRFTGWVVIPLMTTELGTAAWLAVRPGPIPPGLAWLGFGMVCGVWAATATLQVPQHQILARGFEADVHRRLVRTNWVRTVGWTARGALVLVMASMVLS